LISSPLGARILSVSDEFFAAAENLINPKPPISRPGVFIETGAWYDGWETRRHNPSGEDFVVIKLGVASGLVKGVEVDTAFFTGNFAPEISVEGCVATGEHADREVAAAGFQGWKEILALRPCEGNTRQAWTVEGEKVATHVRLRQYPDGGIARFRLYGTVLPLWPADKNELVELSAATNGGVALSCSDQHYGTKDNLILPGRGIDMGDGWETKRTRGDHVDWVIVKLGATGVVKRVVIDTAHFRGNFPKAVKVEGLHVEEGEKSALVDSQDERWTDIVSTTPMSADKEHVFEEATLKAAAGSAFSHVKLTMIPDGGIKRFRVFGIRE
jgi:allantoicase